MAMAFMRSQLNLQLQLDHASTPSVLACAFCGPGQLFFVCGRHAGILEISTGNRIFSSLPDHLTSAKCITSCASEGLVAVASSGSHPSIFVFKVDAGDVHVKFVIPNVCDLDVPDMAFSACGSRLYILAKSIDMGRIIIYNTSYGSVLPGCDAILMLERDQVFFYCYLHFSV